MSTAKSKGNHRFQVLLRFGLKELSANYLAEFFSLEKNLNLAKQASLTKPLIQTIYQRRNMLTFTKEWLPPLSFASCILTEILFSPHSQRVLATPMSHTLVFGLKLNFGFINLTDKHAHYVYISCQNAV